MNALLQDTIPDLETGKEQTGQNTSAVWKIACVAAIGSFMSQLDATIVNVSLARLAVDLRVSLKAIQWVTSGYLLALALTLPLSGWLADRIGQKVLYLWCFAAFTFSSTLCAMAWSANSLIGLRILQGMSGGLLAPMAQLMIARAAGKNIAKVLGIAALPILLAPLLGPVVAGVILQFASWRWLFLINLPVGILALVLAAAFLPNDREKTKLRSLDLFGLALLSPGLVLFLYGLDHLSDRAGTLALPASAILFFWFVRVAKSKGGAALIDLRLLKNKAFSVAIIALFMANGISLAGQMMIPIYLLRACGFSPIQTGGMLAPLGIGMLCTYPFIGRLTDRFGFRAVAASGAMLALLGTLPLVFSAHHGLIIAVLAVGLFVRGAGVGATGIPLMICAYASVPRADLSHATTAVNIIQRLGGPTLTTVCAIFLGWRLAATTTGHVTTSDAFVAAFGLICVLQAVLLLIALQLPDKKQQLQIPSYTRN